MQTEETATRGRCEAEIAQHVREVSAEARNDIARGDWDEVMTDALYAACGAQTVEEMREARQMAEESALLDYDPTPICTVCDTGRSPEGTCTCPPTAEHLDDLKRAQEHRALSQLASPASQMRSVQATTMAHLANVTHAEAAFRACTWNLLTYLASQPYTDVVVSRRADKSAMGPVTIVDLWFKVGHFTFKSEAVSHVEENNGFINVTLA